MWDLLTVAIRNVGRNKRRAFITGLTVFIGISVIVMARGLLNGLQYEFKSSLVRKIHGDLQIHHTGYQDSLDTQPFKLLIPYSDSVASHLTNQPNIEAVTPRLKIMGLLNHQKSQSTTPVMIMAYDTTELDVCERFATALQSGHLIDAKQERQEKAIDFSLEEAVGLDEETELSKPKLDVTRSHHDILLTPSLMRGFSATLGDEVVLLVQDKNNMQQAIVATIAGVIDYALPNSTAKMMWMDFKTLQQVLGVSGYASEIAIKTTEDTDLDAIRDTVSTQLPSDQIVETWLDLGGFFRDIMNLQNTIFSTIILVVLLIVISAIINTSLMTVMERTREIGTLMALGYRRRHIIFLFCCESLVIGFAGGLLGIGLVTSILKTLQTVGISFVLPGETSSIVLYPYVTLGFILSMLSAAVLSAFFASFYPAYRASLMKPVEALTTY